MSLLDPTAEVRKILIYGAILALTATFGMIGGCEYKQREWDKDKLASSEAARKLEKHDNLAGHRKIEQLGEDKVTISEANAWVQKALKDSPKKLVNWGQVEVVKAPSLGNSEEMLKAEGKKDEITTENLQPLLTRDFMQLYDVSVDPSNVGLRGSTYGTPAEIPVNEGLEVVTKNNAKFSEDRAQLKRLQERICEKQKLYEQPISKHCQSQ